MLRRFDLSSYDQEQVCQNFENNANIMKKVSAWVLPRCRGKKTFMQMRKFFCERVEKHSSGSHIRVV